jgi:hypothetical protein
LLWQNKTQKEFKTYAPTATASYRQTKLPISKPPAVGISIGSKRNSKKEPQRYTGTLVKGISTMHKSNAVPIINEQEARDHANMRR